MLFPSRSTDPESGFSSPARIEISVVFPDPEKPTIETNSPRSIVRLIPPRTSVLRPGGPNPLRTSFSSRSGIASRDLEPGFDEAHHPVEQEPDHADGADAEDDVLVDQAVVFLPEEAAHAGRPRQHL